MALEHCPACTTAYSVGAPACPHCQHPTEHPVPKSYAIGPASYAGHADVSPEDVSEPDWQPPVPAQEPTALDQLDPKPEPKPARKRTHKKA
jgi:hypothetical protein